MDKTIARFLCLILAPLALIIIELNHPSGFGSAVYDHLNHVNDLWLTIHAIQPLFFALVGMGGIMLSIKYKNKISYISIVAFFLFIVYYTAYDSVAGIGSGVIIDVTSQLPSLSLTTGKAVLQKYYFHPIFGGSHSVLSEFASLTWIVATFSLAGVLYSAKKPIIPLLFLLLSGGFVWHNHGYPTGPMGFTCYLIAMLWIEYLPVTSQKNKPNTKNKTV